MDQLAICERQEKAVLRGVPLLLVVCAKRPVAKAFVVLGVLWSPEIGIRAVAVRGTPLLFVLVGLAELCLMSAIFIPRCNWTSRYLA